MNYLKVGSLLCLFLIIGSGTLFAQVPETIDHQGELSKSIQSGTSVLILNLGVGFPSGEYADKETGGVAENGFNIGVEFQYNLTESFYLGAMYRNQTNPTDDDAMRSSMSAAMPPGVGVKAVTVDNWKLNSYLVGVGTISELNNEDVKFYTKMMLGLCSADSPSIQATLSDGNSELTINQLSAEANNFAALFGIGLRLHAGSSVDILISGDYFVSNLEFEDVMITAQGQGTENVGNVDQSVDIMSLSVGLVFKL